MFSSVKSLFRWLNPLESVSKSSTPAAGEVEKSPPTPPHEPEPAPPAKPHPVASTECLEIPLRPILDRLPDALREQLARRPRVSELLALPLATILTQLPSGAVKIPLGQFKKAVAPGLFSNSPGLDASLIEIPLSEILSRLNPSYLNRRSEQKRVPVPNEIGAIFANQHRSAGPAANDAPMKAAPISIEAGDDLKCSQAMADATSGQTAALPSSAIDGPASHQPTPVAAPRPISVPASEAGQPDTESSPTPAAEEAQPFIKVTLAALARNWPEPARRELLAAHVAAAVNIPFAELETALGRGKAIFTWRQIRAWLAPKPVTVASAHDLVSLELPLAILIPPFLARRPAAANQKKRTITEEIPDVFVPRKPGEPTAAKAAAAPVHSGSLRGGLEARTSQTPASILPEIKAHKPILAPAAATALGEAPALARVTGITPADLVQRACRLSGVTGALTATPDGLAIASEVPAGIQPETLAAFLPEIFNRLGQSTRELKLGDPTQVEVLFEKTPLLVCKTSRAYFAVLGKAAEPLPKAQLSVLASQLSGRTN